jgi:hypothetical protein
MTVAPDEAALSLELEMQKAYAAFAAAEAGHGEVATVSTTQPAPVGRTTATEISSRSEAAAPEPVVAVPASPAPEAAQTLSAMASAATEAISAAVKELEEVAASYIADKTPAPATPEPAPVEMAEAATQVPPAASQTAARIEHEPTAAESAPEKQDTPEISSEKQKGDVAVPEAVSATTATTPAFVNEVRAQLASSASQISEAAGEPAARSTPDTARKESDMAATTAAAWASWRQIRESGDPKGTSPEPSRNEVEAASAQEDAIAMAVAAGAEKHPDEASAAPESDSEGIASIVDSVLADLRPKIFEEISRKMGKKK